MMIGSRLGRAASVAAFAGVLAFGAVSVDAQEPADHYVGRPLADVLRELQQQGLRIVFATNVVTADMRVRAAPRATTARRRLDELIAPHGLQARDGPGGTIQIVRIPVAVPRSSDQPNVVTTGTIEGRTVHAWTGAALPDVNVEVDGLTGHVRTDATGRFLLRQVDAGQRTIRASSSGFDSITHAIRVTAAATVTMTVKLSPSTAHSEFVTVTGSPPYGRDPGVASETLFERGQWESLGDGLVDDPLRKLHVAPRVSPVDDFRSEFVVRGAPFRHAEVVIDGISTSWLQHSAAGRADSGSLAMPAADVVEAATLRAGAYPRRYGDRLGAQLELTLREGSRARFGLRGMLGGMHGTVVAEGPIGRAARGSWLAAVRHSYSEWPMEGTESARTVFGFADAVGKVVYDVAPTQQIGLTILTGRANLDEDEEIHARELGGGFNRASLVNLGWRSTIGSTTTLTQRVSLVTHGFLNSHLKAAEQPEEAAERELSYRAELTRTIGGGVLESGAQIGRIAARSLRVTRLPATVPLAGANDQVPGASWARSGYAHFRWAAAPSLTLSPGLRVSDSTLVARPTLARWLLAEWRVAPRWTLSASAGGSRQLPDLHHMAGVVAGTLNAERAAHFDAAIEHRQAPSLRWQATLFSRRESDVLAAPDRHPRIIDGVIVEPEPGLYRNALHGLSRGVELLVERRDETGFAGWAAYAYSRTRQTDADRHETFWAAFDQRHALNLFGVYRFTNRASISTTYRAGSNFPIPGYLAISDGALVAGSRQNEIRLPVYSRLDVRGDYTFDRFGRRITLFAQVLNVLNRTNRGVAMGTIEPSTGRAIGFTDTLFPRRLLAGTLIVF